MYFLRNIHNLSPVKPIQSQQALDEEREEIRAKGKELFSGRTINWDKLGMVDRIKARVSSEYNSKVRDEFKGYIQQKLVRNMNGRVQTYLNNNLDELKKSIQQINDLSSNDIKDLNTIIKEKETSLASKYFIEEKAKLITDLIARECLSSDQANTFINEHPEYQDITSLEKYSEFKTAIYEEFKVPQGERR